MKTKVIGLLKKLSKEASSNASRAKHDERDPAHFVRHATPPLHRGPHTRAGPVTSASVRWEPATTPTRDKTTIFDMQCTAL